MRQAILEWEIIQETLIFRQISGWKTSQNFSLLGILPLCTKNPSVPDLFCVEIKRHKGDLGLSVVLPATCELMARCEVLRLFPEFRHRVVHVQVYLARYVEVDWDSGRSIVAKLGQRPQIPACVAAEEKPRRPRLPRLEDEGGVQ